MRKEQTNRKSILDKLEAAFKLVYDILEEEEKIYVEGLKKVMPKAKFNGNCQDTTKKTYTLVNVCLPLYQQKASILLFLHMDLKGSACQSRSSKVSHVLLAILSNDDLEKPSLQFSFSKFNTKGEVDYLIETLIEYSKS